MHKTPYALAPIVTPLYWLWLLYITALVYISLVNSPQRTPVRFISEMDFQMYGLFRQKLLSRNMKRPAQTAV